MKCPRLVHYRDQELGLHIAFFGECPKEECAWWDKIDKCCYIVSLTEEIAELQGIFLKIFEKLPHAWQFLK